MHDSTWMLAEIKVEKTKDFRVEEISNRFRINEQEI